MAQLGYCVVDLVAQRYESVSKEYARIFGYSEKEFLARFRTQEKDVEWVHPEDHSRLVEAYTHR